MKLHLTFLGTGTSDGVPLIGCDCNVCSSNNPKNKRLRSSAWIHNEDQSISILIDCGPDFREQAIRHNIKRIDAILITHTHWDHIAGINDLRPLATKKGDELRGKNIDIYIYKKLGKNIKQLFPYIFEKNSQIGGGVPAIRLLEIAKDQVFYIKGIRFQPIALYHGEIEILGFLFKNFAYLTDVKTLPQTTMNQLINVNTLIINALRIKPHSTHLNLEESIEKIQEIKPEKTYLIHTTHDLDYEKINKELPKNIFMAYDNLTLNL
jgi:phosphoribosyl 1,2-cyclic phosphate phosphodiesterase